MKNVAVLYCTPGSVYKSLAVECFDEYRDARSYRGWLPVVAHPPCRSWGRLRHLAKPVAWERSLGIHAVHQVRRCGGVLEHPSGSLLWSAPEFGEYGLPLVGSGPDAFGGQSFGVYQSGFGHVAPKRTWLYVVGHARPGELCEVLRPGELCEVLRPGELCEVPRAGELCEVLRPGELCEVLRPGELCEVLRPGELCEVPRAGGLRKVSSQPSARRMDTPAKFAELLLSIAEECGG